MGIILLTRRKMLMSYVIDLINFFLLLARKCHAGTQWAVYSQQTVRTDETQYVSALDIRMPVHRNVYTHNTRC